MLNDTTIHLLEKIKQKKFEQIYFMFFVKIQNKVTRKNKEI